MKNLVIFVEGSSDERFVKSILVPIASTRYEAVKIVTYSGMTVKKLNHLIQGMRATGSEYIYMHDFDGANCISTRKEALMRSYVGLDDERIVIVREEIESWYLAGVDSTWCIKNGMRFLSITDSVTKEQFLQEIPKSFSSRIDFMIELLKGFSIAEARTRNGSFDYLLSRARFGLF